MKLLLTLVILPHLIPFNQAGLFVETYTKEYGEACNSVEKCNFRHWVYCVKGYCDCLSVSTMVHPGPVQFLSFFATRSTLMDHKSCRARVNSPCNKEYYYDDDNNPIPAFPLSQIQEDSIPKQTQLCVHNAFCHPHGVCKCSVNYTVNVDGTCQKLGEFSQNCKRDDDCHPDRFLKCRRGICQCDSGSKYDEKLAKCAVGPGQKCLIALTAWKFYQIDNCGKNSTCHLSRCECARGFIADYRENFCSRDYEYRCDTENPCVNEAHAPKNDQLVCVNGSCTCSLSTSKPTFYRHKFQGCVGLNVGSQLGCSVLVFLSAFVVTLLSRERQ